MFGLGILAKRGASTVAVACLCFGTGCGSDAADEALTRQISFDVQFQPGGIGRPTAEIQKALAPCEIHGREPERGVDRWLVTVSVPETADANDLARRLERVPGITAATPR
jgi:hypothetical protein